jgi:hypothetical protein
VQQALTWGSGRAQSCARNRTPPRSRGFRQDLLLHRTGRIRIRAQARLRNNLRRSSRAEEPAVVSNRPSFAIRVSRATFGIYGNPETSLKLNSPSAAVPIGQPESRGRKLDAERAVAIDSRTYGRSEHEDRSMGFARCSGTCSMRRWEQRPAGCRGISHRRSCAAIDPPRPWSGYLDFLAAGKCALYLLVVVSATCSFVSIRW